MSQMPHIPPPSHADERPVDRLWRVGAVQTFSVLFGLLTYLASPAVAADLPGAATSKGRIAAFFNRERRDEDIRPFGDIPDTQCGDGRALEHIARNFAWAERKTWHRGFVIDRILNPRQRYTVLNGPALIRHRHCVAEAVMTNGRQYPIFYVIGSEMGFASIGDGTDYCVAGLDPWHIYGRSCETLR